MTTLAFDEAVEQMLKGNPTGAPALRRSARTIRTKRLTTFRSLSRAIPRLRRNEAVCAIRLLPFLDRRSAAEAVLSVLRSSGDEYVRLEAARTLAQLPKRRTAKILGDCIREEPDAAVRYWEMYAIACLAEPSIVEQIVAVLTDSNENTRVRSQAAEALGYVLQSMDRRRRTYRKAVDTLIAMLGDPQVEIRFWSCFALGNIKARAALAALRGVQRSDRGVCPGWWAVSAEASDAIRVIGGAAWTHRIPMR